MITLFDKFKEFVMREYGIKIKAVTDKSLAVSFEDMFGCSFLDDVEEIIPDGVDSCINNYEDYFFINSVYKPDVKYNFNWSFTNNHFDYRDAA